MTESNLTTRRIVMCIMMNMSEGRRKRSGWRNILVEDATATGRMIQIMTERMFNALSKFVYDCSPSQISSQPTAIELDARSLRAQA